MLGFVCGILSSTIEPAVQMDAEVFHCCHLLGQNGCIPYSLLKRCERHKSLSLVVCAGEMSLTHSSDFVVVAWALPWTNFWLKGEGILRNRKRGPNGKRSELQQGVWKLRSSVWVSPTFLDTVLYALCTVRRVGTFAVAAFHPLFPGQSGVVKHACRIEMFRTVPFNTSKAWHQANAI